MPFRDFSYELVDVGQALPVIYLAEEHYSIARCFEEIILNVLHFCVLHYLGRVHSP